MLAALIIAGMNVRAATATKNLLAIAMNAATLVFAFSSMISWPAAAAGALTAGGIDGGVCGAWPIHRLPEPSCASSWC